MKVSELKLGQMIPYKEFNIFITGLDDYLHNVETSTSRFHRFVTIAVYSSGLFPEYLFWSGYMFWDPINDEFMDFINDDLFQKYL